MAIAFVQSKSVDSGSVTSATLAFTSNVTAGSLLVVSARLSAQGRTITVTDNNGNPTYTQALNQTDGASGNELFIHHVPNANAGATTVTFALSGAAANLRWAIHEYSGIATTLPLDQIASSTGTAATLTSGATATRTQASELLFGSGEDGTGTAGLTLTAGTNYTQREKVTIGGVDKILTEDQIVSATGTDAATETQNLTDQWAMGIATFKAAATGGTGVISTGGATLNTGPRSPVFARFP